MRYINMIGAVAWAVHFVKFLMGSYRPSDLVIGCALFLSTLYFVTLFTQESAKKRGIK